MTTFEAPSAGTAAYQGTIATTINNSGAVVGWYADANKVVHSFLRTP
jgi:probable HAF family extracellular repeat protein